MYQNLREYKAAIKTYKQALSIDPNHSGTHNNLAVVYYTVGQFKLALEHVDKAQSLGFKVQQAFMDEISKYR